MTLRARIVRGAVEIGGSCIELECGGYRLILDLGLPLSSQNDSLPDISGLREADPTLLGIVLSHPHMDHCGLIDRVRPDIPIYMGEAAARILNEAAFFIGKRSALVPAQPLTHEKPIQIGPFRVTPFLNDHSAFDAYSLLVEAEGRRLFYTGDLRAHGRKPGCFRRLLRSPPADVDVLLMEGTRLGRQERSRETTEEDVEHAAVEVFRRARGSVLAFYSPQNVDRLVSLYRACIRSGRILVLDLYAHSIAVATGRASIPRASFDQVRIYLPHRQKAFVKRERAFHRTDAVREARIYPEEMASRGSELVFTFRQSMAAELESMGCLADAEAIWSMWPGYLDEASGRETSEWLESRGIPMSIIHSSGHASLLDLQRLVEAMLPARVVPIHTEAPEEFVRCFPNVEQWADGEWRRIQRD